METIYESERWPSPPYPAGEALDTSTIGNLRSGPLRVLCFESVYDESKNVLAWILAVQSQYGRDEKNRILQASNVFLLRVRSYALHIQASASFSIR